MQPLKIEHQKSQERQGEIACVKVNVLHVHKTQHRLRGIPWLWDESPKSHGLDEINDDDNSGMSSTFCLFLRAVIKQFGLSAIANHVDVRKRSWPVSPQSLPAIRGAEGKVWVLFVIPL